MTFRDGGLEPQDGVGALHRMIETGQFQHVTDVATVVGTQRLFVRVQVRFTIAKAKATLQEEHDIGLLAVIAGLHRQA